MISPEARELLRQMTIQVHNFIIPTCALDALRGHGPDGHLGTWAYDPRDGDVYRPGDPIDFWCAGSVVERGIIEGDAELDPRWCSQVNCRAFRWRRRP